MKKKCTTCQEKTEHKTITTETPQGWPQVIEECQKCKLRIQVNNPEADAKKSKQ